MGKEMVELDLFIVVIEKNETKNEWNKNPVVDKIAKEFYFCIC